MGALWITFFTDEELSEDALLRTFQKVIPISSVVRVEDVMEVSNDDFISHTLFIEKRDQGGQFRFYYRVASYYGIENFTFRNIIDLLGRLAQEGIVNILLGDDDINPFIFIHIDQNGQSGTVGVVAEDYNDRDELTIEDVYNHAFGSFATEAPLLEKDETLLRSLLAEVIPNFELTHWDYATAPMSFGTIKNEFEQLRHLEHHYIVRPTGRNPWYSKDEKAEIFAVIMMSFNHQTKKTICFFPANSGEIKNIPGGSDSEEFCIWVEGGHPTKIIYKPRRKNWLTE